MVLATPGEEEHLDIDVQLYFILRFLTIFVVLASVLT